MRQRTQDCQRSQIVEWLSRDPIAENGGINLYGYVGNNPINLYDPMGLTWTSNWNFLGNWLNGSLPNNEYFYGDDTETQELANSPAGQNMRNQFQANHCNSTKNISYGTLQAGWDTVANPFTADWSSTAAQVGGYAGASATNNGNGTVTYRISNTAGTSSFFAGQYTGVPDSPLPIGPMHNVNQHFEWTEKIPSNGSSSSGGCGGGGG